MRRPDFGQITYIFGVMRGIKHPRFEQLSAAAFQLTNVPDLDAAVTIGRSERLAMVAVDFDRTSVAVGSKSYLLNLTKYFF